MRPQNTVTCVYRFFLYDVTAYDITQCLDFYLVKFIIIIFLINWFAAICYGEIKMNIC